MSIRARPPNTESEFGSWFLDTPTLSEVDQPPITIKVELATYPASGFLAITRKKDLLTRSL